MSKTVNLKACQNRFEAHRNRELKAGLKVSELDPTFEKVFKGMQKGQFQVNVADARAALQICNIGRAASISPSLINSMAANLDKVKDKKQKKELQTRIDSIKAFQQKKMEYHARHRKQAS